MSDNQNVEVIREIVGDRPKRPEGGTILRFKSGVYTYAAIFIKEVDQWFVSGEGRYWGRNVFEYDYFKDQVLAKAHSIEVATSFEEVE